MSLLIFPQGEEHLAVVGRALLVKDCILEIDGVRLDILNDIVIVDGFFHHKGGAAVRAGGGILGGIHRKGRTAAGAFGGQQRDGRDLLYHGCAVQWQYAVQITGKEAPI